MQPYAIWGKVSEPKNYLSMQTERINLCFSNIYLSALTCAKNSFTKSAWLFLPRPLRRIPKKTPEDLAIGGRNSAFQNKPTLLLLLSINGHKMKRAVFHDLVGHIGFIGYNLPPIQNGGQLN